MNFRSPRFEKIAYLLAFLLAFGLRFARLGAVALTDSEATFALQALHLAQGLKPAISSNVAYINLTAILFYIFGASNFLARFWPALVGSALVFVPWLFRERIKPRPAMLLAIFLAMDPAFVAVSRMAGSSIFAIAGLFFAVGFWLRGQSRLAGIFTALALLSGPSLWAGLLGLLLTWLISQGFSLRPRADETEADNDTAQPATPAPDYKSLVVTALVSLAAISTLLLVAPQGLGAWLASLPTYLSGWVSQATAPTLRMFTALATYQPLALVLAVIAIVRGWMGGSRRIILLSLWMLVALILAVFYPLRTPVDLVWALVPLWSLAALELSRHFRFVREDRLETLGVFIFTVLLLSFAWLDLAALYWTPIPSKEGNLRLYLLLGSALLLVVSIILVGYGWSGRIARVGAAWGIGFIFGLYTLGAAWSVSGLRVVNSVELYQPDATIAQAHLLSQTTDQISEWATGDKHALPVLVFGVDSPALLWALRDHNPQVVTALDSSASPELVITPPQQNLQLASSYRGQDFTWRQTPSWDVFSAYSLRWLTVREMPVQPENIVLWARNDLFIDSE